MSKAPRPFAPLAIVGRACTLPDASSPADLWRVVAERRDVVTDVPRGRFRVDPALVHGVPGACVDRTYSTRGGYVRDTRPVDDAGLDLDVVGGASGAASLDPLFHWVLRAGRDCLVDAGFDPSKRKPLRATAVLGNLSFPTEAMTLLGEQQLLDALDPSSSKTLRKKIGGAWANDVDARNRFMSGLPAHILARALHFTGGAFSLDAACASSLYALRLAALALDDGRADVVLAGAVNRADSLFLHVGFCALQALSPRGVARPFDRKADGLVPAEGCAFVALMRLDDAIAQGKKIHGVVRGVGLSNDGRGKNLLAPSSEGQVRAIRAAWSSAQLSSSTCDYVECHATGTPMGDRTEVMSVSDAFATKTRTFSSQLPLGSLKGNLGHLITAAGVAGLIKVTEAFAHETIPASIHADEPLDVLDGALGVVVQRENAAWPSTKDRPRRAGVSAFGFGGNNAHVVVDEPPRTKTTVAIAAREIVRVPKLAVVSVGVRLGSRKSLNDLAHDAKSNAATSIDVSLDNVRFPPNDLSTSIAQQLLVFEAARDAARDVDALFATSEARERCGVFIGMGTDVRITSPGLRWRAPEIAARLDVDDAAFVDALRNAATDAHGAQHILGCMPNIPANRVNVQLDLRGPGFTTSSEEHSGLAALDVARGLIAHGEIDAAIVGAVDACNDERHVRALHAVRASLGLAAIENADAGAIVFVVVSEERARDEKLPVLAVLDVDARDDLALKLDATTEQGAHAASAMFAIAKAISHVATHRKRNASPWFANDRAISVDVAAMFADTRTIVVRSASTELVAARVRDVAPAIFVASAASRTALVDALKRGASSTANGTWRASIVARDANELTAKRARLASRLERESAVDDDANAMWARESKAASADDACLLFGTAGLVAPGTGLELARAFPEVVTSLNIDMSALEAVLAGTRHPRGCLADLAMATAAMQIGARAVVDVLGVRTKNALGISLGESNALFATGAWPELGAMLDDMERSRLFDEILFGRFSSARAYWEQLGRADLCNDPWRAVSVRAPLDRIRAACDDADVRGFCFVLVVHADDEAEIGGAPFAVDAFVKKLGVTAVPMAHMPSVHCPLLDPARDAYRSLHRRHVAKVDARLHSHGAHDPLSLTDDDVADAILAQARTTVDVPARVRRVIHDGVRVFIDVSPRGLAGSWVRRIDPRVDVVSVDGTVASLTHAAAKLHVAGVDVDVTKLAAIGPSPKPARTMTIETARPLRALAAMKERVDVMTAPPKLPRITPEMHAHGAPAEHPTDVDDTHDVAPVANDAPVIDGGAALVAANRSLALDAHRGMLDAMTEAHRSFLAHREAHVARMLSFDERDVISSQLLDDDAKHETHVDGARTHAKALWDRADLEVLAGGRIADVWGEQFAVQDGFRRQVRMPMAPLLLADRVMSIDATPGVLERNKTIVTETDLRPDLWYLHENRCPAGVLIETGQADLLLISYMGVDFENRGERVYRLLGCDLQYRAPLPLAGTTLQHDIHIDGFAQGSFKDSGDVRIFFFHSDTSAFDSSKTDETSKRPVLTVREGQAGFFTDEELAKSGGILWKPSDVDTRSLASLPLAKPPRPAMKRSFTRADLDAFADGRIADCFGAGFEIAKTHVATPKIPAHDLLLLDRVVDVDFAGGPWQRGYLKAEYDLDPSRWFFDGHFKDDPCMPGTIMFEGCLETLAVYLAAAGFTLEKDGHRFEPAVDKTFRLRCRGQATPSSKKLTYEVFVKSLVDGPEPAVTADILVTIDGLKSLHCESVELKLAADVPLTRNATFAPSTGVSPSTTHALLATAIGRPSDAFPGLYERFDDGKRVPRLPGPPYHFMTRVAEVGGPDAGSLARNESAAGTYAVVEYEVPPDAWYFEQWPGLNDAMPFAVLLEVALQPCGWVSSVVGSALTTDDELFYRNLDGTARIHREVTRDVGTLITRATLKKSSSSGGMIIQEHDVMMTTSSGEPVFECSTVFGFFPKEALARQVGITTTDVERARMAERCASFTPVDVALTAPQLRMIDRVTGVWPASSSSTGSSRARIRAEKRVDAGEWFFKAHFFQDPVQPGSLGLEAIAQSIAWLALHEGHAQHFARPRIESLATGVDVTWKYRGQVLPKNELVQVDAEIVEVVDEGASVLVRANGSLWVDGTRIYTADGISIRIVDR